MPADNTHHLITAARQRHELTRSKAIQALRELDRAGAPVSFQTVAQQASISRSWLYTQPDIRAEVDRPRTTARPTTEPSVPACQRSSEASLQRRLEAANSRNRRLAEENSRLRRQLAEALGPRRLRCRGGRVAAASGRVPARGIPVPAAERALDGSYTSEHHGRRYVLFPFVDGRQGTWNDADAIARAMRVVHEVTDLVLPRTDMGEWYIEVLRDRHDHPWIVDRRDEIRANVDRLEAVIERARAIDVPYVVCSYHGLLAFSRRSERDDLFRHVRHVGRLSRHVGPYACPVFHRNFLMVDSAAA